MNLNSKAQSSLDSEDHKGRHHGPHGSHFAEGCSIQFFTTVFYRRVEVFLKFETVKVNTSFT